MIAIQGLETAEDISEFLSDRPQKTYDLIDLKLQRTACAGYQQLRSHVLLSFVFIDLYHDIGWMFFDGPFMTARVHEHVLHVFAAFMYGVKHRFILGAVNISSPRGI